MLHGVTIRTAETFDEKLAAAVVRDACFPPSVTTRSDLERMLARDPDSYHLIAERDGRPVGAGTCLRFTGLAIPGLLVGGAFVLPEARRQGLGSELLRLVTDRAVQRGAELFGGLVRGDDPDSIGWLERRGFFEQDRIRRSALDVASAPDGAPQPPAGIVLTTLAQHPELERATYEVDCEARVDIPSRTPLAAETYESWRDSVIGRSGVDPRSVFLALAGDEVAGFGILGVDQGRPDVGLHIMTGVARSWRGRGVAWALKLQQVAWARENGLRTLETDNNELNEPMRAINRRLGYEPLPDTVAMGAPLPLGAGPR